MRLAARIYLLLLIVTAPVWADDDLRDSFERDSLVIITSERACRSFDVYLARSFEQKRRGLMHVRDLPDNVGMLFIYEDDDVRSMWMKNTYIPLDILFVRDDGSIARIAKNTEPLSLDSISSGEPVSYVLELNAGITDRFGIDQNSRLFWAGMTSDDQ